MKKIPFLFYCLSCFLIPLQGQQINIQVIKEIPSCWGLCCGQAEISVSGTNPPFNYQWSTGATGTNIQNLVPGSYTVTVTDFGNYSESQTIIIGALGVINEVEELVSQSCFGEEDVVLFNNITEGIPPYFYNVYDEQDNLIQFSGPTFDSTYLFENLKGGATYRIVVNDGRVCFAENIITTSEQPQFLTALGPDIYLPPGESFTLTPAFSDIPVSFLWSPPDGLSCFDCQNPTVTSLENICYTLTAYNENGCESKDTICIEVEPNSIDQELQNKNEYRFFPNPVESELTIQADFNEKISIEVLDLLGKKIPFDLKSSNTKTLILGLNDIPSGIYLIKIQGERGEILSIQKVQITR